jgi:acyl-CoA dehydrogenase
MDFSLPHDLLTLKAEIDTFVRRDVIPFESDPRWTAHGPTDELRRALNAKAKAANLLAVHVSEEFGGRGLSHVGKAVALEAAGYSMLGPVALHCHAPDEGNIHLMDIVATPAQKEKYLRPLATAVTRSCFAMTEPEGGAGSDPSMLKTRATPDGNGWRISGRKWLITGAEGAAFAIIMARTGDGPGDATMFLTPLPNPAFKLTRTLDTMDSSFMGGHAVVDIGDLKVSGDDVLGEVGLQVCPGAPCSCPPHALHALARRSTARARYRHGLRPRTEGVRQAARPPRRRFVHAGRQCDGHAHGTTVDLALCLGARSGRAWRHRKFHGQGDLF